MMLSVNTIYPAFMGEVNCFGIGAPCTFIRLAGCNLRCYFATKGTLCDTPEALERKKGTAMTDDEIISKVGEFKNKLICLTGGEPLAQDVRGLLTKLSNDGYNVVIETNGSKSIVPYRHIRNVSFVLDVKSKSSGESERMVESNYMFLDNNDFLKFVIDTKADFEDFMLWMDNHEGKFKCRVAVGVFWGSEITYYEIMQRLRTSSKYWSNPVYINMQTHKMAFLYDGTKDSDTFSNLFIPKEI